jgi:arginyl-tRNA--protein-N-Asp/Glu arginylyltransferase
MFASEKNLDWIYLGYYVKGCPSLEYKSKYIEDIPSSTISKVVKKSRR